MPSQNPPPRDTYQRTLLRHSITALGGIKRTALATGLSPRHIRGMAYEGRPIHTGILETFAGALTAHAKTCRMLERELSPAYSANLSPEQSRSRPAHLDGRKKARR